MTRRFVSVFTLFAAALAPAPAPAFLYWAAPSFQSGQVAGTEAGIVLPLPDAKPAELAANLLWAMRAGLNVAALQCQFAPGLMTVHYYNDILRRHAVELNKAQATLAAYFKRTAGKKALETFDSYNTMTYNGFSTYLGQLGFCETAATIDREAMATAPGQLGQTAAMRMREFRAAQTPVSDMAFAFHVERLPMIEMPILDPVCLDRKNRRIDCSTGKRIREL